MDELVEHEYGLRSPRTGYVRTCRSLGQAEDLKSGREIDGRRGDWTHHVIVTRLVVTTIHDWQTNLEGI